MTLKSQNEEYCTRNDKKYHYLVYTAIARAQTYLEFLSLNDAYDKMKKWNEIEYQYLS